MPCVREGTTPSAPSCPGGWMAVAASVAGMRGIIGMREMGILGMGKIKGRGGCPQKTCANIRQGGETLRRRCRPGRNIPPRGNAPAETSVLPPPAKKIPPFFRAAACKGAEAGVSYASRPKFRATLLGNGTVQFDVRGGRAFPWPVRPPMKIGEPNQEET